MVGFPMKKKDSHGFSGLASWCVEWFDPNMERTNREAPSPSFLQEKKHLKKAPKVQMPRCSSMYASMMQLADAYDSTYACSRSMEASKQYHGT